LMSCFAGINVSQGSVATYARCGGIFDIRLTANLPRNLSVKKTFLNRLRLDRITVVCLWYRFLAHPVHHFVAVWLDKSLVIRRQYSTSCTSGFVDDVMFTC